MLCNAPVVDAERHLDALERNGGRREAAAAGKKVEDAHRIEREREREGAASGAAPRASNSARCESALWTRRHGERGRRRRAASGEERLARADTPSRILSLPFLGPSTAKAGAWGCCAALAYPSRPKPLSRPQHGSLGADCGECKKRGKTGVVKIGVCRRFLQRGRTRPIHRARGARSAQIHSRALSTASGCRLRRMQKVVENWCGKNRGLSTVFAEAGKRAAGASQARRTIRAALARTTRAARRAGRSRPRTCAAFSITNGTQRAALESVRSRECRFHRQADPLVTTSRKTVCLWRKGCSHLRDGQRGRSSICSDW